jgi:selenocysteine-specific elongation factor
VRKDDELEVHPGGKRLRVRGVQVHGAAAEKAIAGQRTALNLAGVEVSELARGMMLTAAGLFRPTSQVSVELNLLPSAKPLRDRARVHLHAFTAETIAEVSLLEGRQLKPGQSGLARLKLDAPLLLLPGDRFIVRQFSPVITIGGGQVLDASEPARRVKADERLEFVKAVAAANPGDVLLARVARRGASGLSLADAVTETGWLPARVHELSGQLQKAGKVTLCDGLMIAADRFAALRRQALAAVEQFHKQNPLVAGINQEQLREPLGVAPEIFRSLLDTLVREKKLEIAGDQVRGAGRAVVFRDDEAESKQTIEQAFAKAGLQVPALKEVLASLRIDQSRAQKIVTLLLRDRVLVKLADDLVFHRDALEALRHLVTVHKTKTQKLNVASFKGLAGVSRKYAIPLLEYLDRERVTRRVGDERVIL